MRGTVKQPYRPPVKSPSLPSNAGRVIGFDSAWGWGTETVGTVTGVSPNHWHIIAEKRIAPLFAQGLLREMIWMPFGGGQSDIDRGLLDFYAFTEVAETDLTKDFVSAMMDLRTQHPDRQLAIYYGSLGTRAELPVYQKELEAWRCIQPLIDAGIKMLLIDGANQTPDGTWEQKFLDQLIAGGISVYCETRPYINDYKNGYPVGSLNWVHSRPFISDREFFVASDENPNAYHDTKGERILLLHGTPESEIIAEAKKTLTMVDVNGRGGFSVCCDLYTPCVRDHVAVASDIWK